MKTTAEIITIGDEILYGQTLDTNSHWISGKLDEVGIRVIRKTTIPDTKQDILQAFADAENRADITLITGGLGPTNDDLTKPCLVEYFNTKLVRHEDVLDHIRTIFSKINRVPTQLNEKQADLPENCTAIPNPFGTAAGMWFERNEKVMISMPGVPFEMKKMMEDTILPKLKAEKAQGQLFHQIIRTVGIPESALSIQIKDWEDALPESIKLAYLPSILSVKLRLTGFGDDLGKIKKMVSEQTQLLLPQIEQYVYSMEDEELEVTIGKLLKEKGLKLAIAESCTGGYMSHKITSIAGSSQWYAGSVIPYSNELKEELLGVKHETLVNHGAVSEQTVLEMAKATREKLQSDIAVSISGIAGPSGGSEEKPVGTVWVGYSDSSKTTAQKFQFSKSRSLNIEATATVVMEIIWKSIKSL